ncbi:hypothetical protein I4U23_007568 [Adineta vaga]|nr:hypothetical protein I4U23_007568 [Adineta vaga]
MSSGNTNFIDFLHDHYSNGTTNDMSDTLTRLQQHLEQQRKLVLNEIATVKKEEEQIKSFVQLNSTNQEQLFDNIHKKDSLTSLDIEEINKLPLDL